MAETNIISIDRLIDRQAAANPTKIAIRHNDVNVTYQTVNETSNRLARYLISKNILPGDNVAVAVNRSPDMIMLLLAVAKTGAAYLPLDVNFPIDRIIFMVEDADVKAIITKRKLKHLYTGNRQVICIEDALEECAALEAGSFPSLITEQSIAYILYTSGSTGKPKGVKVKHAGLSNLLLSVQNAPGMTADDVMLHTTTISFDIAELEVYLPLICGALLVIADAEKVKDGRALLEIAIAEGISIMQGTPFMWRTMLEAGWEEKLPIKVFCGGEAMTKELATRLLPRCNELWNMYGPTETTIYSIIKKVSPADGVITIGDPIANTQVYILNDQLQQVATGEVGEIYIAGDGVAEGYLNKPELTQERFIADPFTADGAAMYKTGDLGKFLPNGEILCLGRIDHQIKIRGYRIETEEVEHQLKEQDTIKNALIVLHEDKMGNPHLVAYIVPEEGTDTSDEAAIIGKWKTQLLSKLPDYMVPNTYMIIDAIPLMPNGKTDRKSLPEPVINKYVSKDYEEAQTETQTKLVKIALKSIAIDKIGINDNFFELGVNSLIAVSMMVQVEKVFGKRLPLSVLIKYPTIKALAAVIDDPSLHASYKTLVPIQPNGSKIPVYVIHGIGLNLLNLYNMISNLDADQPVYGVQSIGLDGTMELPGTLEEIAAFYNDEIIKNDPVGPYALAGYSFGGFIAWEMGCQLKKMGKEVSLLAMFDTNLQIPTHQYPLGKKLVVKAMRQLKKASYRIYTAITDPVNLSKFLKENNSARIKTLLNKVGVLEHYDRENLPDFMQVIAHKLNNAFFRYTFKPYHVKVDIFKAQQRFYYIDDSKYLGWKPYALDGVDVHTVPGDHKDMFDDENSKTLADIFQQRLNQMNAAERQTK